MGIAGRLGLLNELFSDGEDLDALPITAQNMVDEHAHAVCWPSVAIHWVTKCTQGLAGNRKTDLFFHIALKDDGIWLSAQFLRGLPP